LHSVGIHTASRVVGLSDLRCLLVSNLLDSLLILQSLSYQRCIVSVGNLCLEARDATCA